MPDQITLVGKACRTLLTLEWLDSSMASEVQLQVGWGRKLFSTKITRIHLFIDFLWVFQCKVIGRISWFWHHVLVLKRNSTWKGKKCKSKFWMCLVHLGTFHNLQLCLFSTFWGQLLCSYLQQLITVRCDFNPWSHHHICCWYSKHKHKGCSI